MEILISVLIVFLAGFIIFRSFKNSSKGKCNCGCKGCKGCKTEKISSEKSNIIIK